MLGGEESYLDSSKGSIRLDRGVKLLRVSLRSVSSRCGACNAARRATPLGVVETGCEEDWRSSGASRPYPLLISSSWVRLL